MCMCEGVAGVCEECQAYITICPSVCVCVCVCVCVHVCGDVCMVVYFPLPWQHVGRTLT